MKVNKYWVPVLAIVFLLGAIGVAQATGLWIVSGKQMIDVEHLASSADIRGWMTLQEIAGGLGLELSTVYAVTGIPQEAPPDTALKDLESVVPDFEVSGVRDALAVYLGEPGASDVIEAGLEVTARPAEEEIVAPDAKTLRAEEAVTLPTPEPPTVEHTPQTDVSSAEGAAPGTSLAPADIKGRHTLQEIADGTQVPLSDLLAELGLAPDTDPQQAVRDLVEAGQIVEVDAVRQAVTVLQQR